jgi:hypothetical protein
MARVLDLTDPATRDAFKLKPKDLVAAWQRAIKPTRTQLLGLAASERGVSAVRFSSDAARVHGLRGCNVVIFPRGMQVSDRVHILGPTKQPLQTWPQ